MVEQKLMKIKPWVSEAVEVKQSGMEGKGVYSVRKIKKGRCHWCFRGNRDARRRYRNLKKECFPGKALILITRCIFIPASSCCTIMKTAVTLSVS